MSRLWTVTRRLPLTSTLVVALPGDRREALAFLKRPDLLDEVGRGMDALGYVGETSTKILGYLISVSASQFDTAGLFASLVVTTILGLLIDGAVVIVGRYLLRWQ